MSKKAGAGGARESAHESAQFEDGGSSAIPGLTPGERRAWLALTGVAIKLPALLDSQLKRECSLSFYEYMVLATLSEAPGGVLRMSQLSRQTSGSLSRLSHVAKRLEDEGLIRRETATGDRRSTNAILTDAGLARVHASGPRHVASARQLVFDALDADQIAVLAQIGEAILGRIDPGASGPEPR